MRIAHLISSGQLGGSEASLLEMIGSVREARPDWSFLVVTPEHGALEERLRSLGVPVEVLPYPRGLARLGEAGRDGLGGRVRLAFALGRASADAWVYRRRLRDVLTRRAGSTPFDVVHAHGFKMHVLSARSVPARTALIWHMHDYVSTRPISARLVRRLARRCDVLIANSKSVEEDVRRVCGNAPRIQTIYNAVDLMRFSPAGAVLDLDRLGRASPAAPGTIRVGLLATFGRWKGQRTFLGALAHLPPELPVRGYVIGGPIYQTAASQLTELDVRRAAADLGLADRVVFTGPVRDAAGALRALDIAVHASTEPEPFGMVIAEAMACGRPVIVSMAGGVAELVEEGVDGLGHAPGDERALAAAIERLVADAALRQRLGRAARATAERRFDRARLAVELVPLYEHAGTV